MFIVPPASMPRAHPAPALVMPPASGPVRRTSIPWIASLVPVLGAAGLWAVTGSLFVLWFAVLGPVIAGAAALDGRRAQRRDRRDADRDRARARTRIETEIDRRHAQERDAMAAQHPDVVGYLGAPHEIWRVVPAREGVLRVGRGPVESAVRVEGDDDEVVQALRARAAHVPDAPVLIPDHVGVAIVGPPVFAEAVARALVIQLCCTRPPGRMQLNPARSPAWAASLPHRAPAATACHLDTRDAAVRRAGDPAIVVVPPGAVPPPHCGAVLTLDGIETARLDYAGRSIAVRTEGLGQAQAARIAGALAERADTIGGVDRVPDAVAFEDLDEGPAAPAGERPDLRVMIGHDGTGPVAIDLVADGPHAIVTGMTGAGKSELLVSWVARLCATRSTRDVVFLLADFKGGTAFDVLAEVPHVTGVLTDLDGAGASRALDSLRAEIRHREEIIARAGARDILDPAVDLPRLVIVVDELAALLDGHRELGAVFADVAARGRALGMHLILGTQRATGVAREALMANCPLRISLRVVDGADSTFVLGSDAAAALPGDPGARGLALIRRAADAAPTLVRIVRTRPADISRIQHDRAAEPRPRRPWQPALPPHLSLDDLRPAGETTAEPVIGLADEPDRQRHHPVRLHEGDAGLAVIGGPGTGKSTALAAISAQIDPARVVRLPVDPEPLWDLLCELTDRGPAPDTLLVADDLDVALASFPPDYAIAVATMVEQLCRSARSLGCRVILSTARLAGPVARIAELLPRRAVLRVPTRVEHAAAGADPAAYDPALPPGRAQLDGRTVQIASAERIPPPAIAVPEPWRPGEDLSGLVMRAGGGARRLAAALAADGVDVLHAGDDHDALTRRIDTADRPVVILGEPEQWQRAWRMLQTVRARGELVVDAACLVEYRLLTGDRILPPYCAPGRGRAWLLRDGEPPARTVLPGQEHPLRQRVA
ncbi:FtsK/SpoIIIE domain-containing protein [Microbacterium sp. cx-59]|uniref:FtsK/SpoIIIE domain-containing protein n=1 Tax=Microbacterium sp. cx-59 TaxID=2891207 RepID=UPI001E4E3F96|nr:FtsK/SpoIIIE domain-containing protein [Microbacterium sp. cx-59]MCC4909673.1 cell division protein FtsK [Microbacterium sp. cx-59]